MIDTTSTTSGPRVGLRVQQVLDTQARASRDGRSSKVGVGCLAALVIGHEALRDVGVVGRALRRPSEWSTDRRVSPSSSPCPRSSPSASTPACGCVGDQRDAGVVEVLALGRLRLGAVLGELGDRLDAERGHLERELHRGGADDAGLDVVDTGAAAVDRDDGHVLLLAGGLERLVCAGRGGLVDRVDEVDRRVLLQQVLHRGTAAVLGAVGDVVPDDPRVVLVADLGLVADVDRRSPPGSPGHAGRRRRPGWRSGRAGRSSPACRRCRTSPSPTDR